MVLQTAVLTDMVTRSEATAEAQETQRDVATVEAEPTRTAAATGDGGSPRCVCVGSHRLLPVLLLETKVMAV